MSADVQVRKRKDKKKKREDEELKESHHGVHITKMGADDVHFHVQADHDTGGHWCAKIFFFSLLAVLLGLIGLIIMENRDLSDLDTPLSESRFSEYFKGWVDEYRELHDEHGVEKVMAALEDHDGEPFDEENYQSEQEEEKEHELETEHDDKHEQETKGDRPDKRTSMEDKEQNEQLDNENEQGDEKEMDEDYQLPSKQEQDGETEDETNEIFNEEDRHDEESEELNNKNIENAEEFGDEEDSNEDFDNLETKINKSSQMETTTNHYPFEEQVNNNITIIINSAHSVQVINLRNTSETITEQIDLSQENCANKENDFDDDEDQSVEIVENDAGEILHLQQQRAKQEPKEPGIPKQESSSSAQIKSRGQQSFDEDVFINGELRRANGDMLQNNLKSALKIYDSLILKNPLLPGALYGKAKVLDRLAEEYKSNQMLNKAINLYDKFLNFGDAIDSKIFLEAAERCIDRMRFQRLHIRAIKIHQMLIKRFGNDPHYRNQLAVTYLLLNRLVDAKRVLHNVLLRWRDDGFAQVHYGFVLKNLDHNLEKAVVFLKEGIESRVNGTQDGRFFFNLGDALQRLGKREEAIEIYRKGASLKLFPSEYQRSLYNVKHLKAQPFWTKTETMYAKYLDIFEQNYEKIQEEGLVALNDKGYFLDETESLKDVGDWKQFELFARGYKNMKNCQKAPFTCKLIETFPAARHCKRGQVKFSVMHPGTHIWPHCGPTNCRLRAHLGLKVPSNTTIAVAEEKRSWEEGQLLIFDDSFEHEVWHNGTSLRLVLIIDVWHPDLTQFERENLGPI